VIFDAALIEKFKKCALAVDLASAPGGFDMEAAEELGANVVTALSLPGKSAPQSAAEILYETVINILKEQE
jgi:dipicolinate synthase subunit A